MSEQFELSEPFDIDGLLEAHSREKCFVLGYELAQIHSLTRRRGPFEKVFHYDNEERVRKHLERHGLADVEVRRINDDWCVARRGDPRP